eukprot:580752-Hanusia_phi.AAC.1
MQVRWLSLEGAISVQKARRRCLPMEELASFSVLSYFMLRYRIVFSEQGSKTQGRRKQRSSIFIPDSFPSSSEISCSSVSALRLSHVSAIPTARRVRCMKRRELLAACGFSAMLTNFAMPLKFLSLKRSPTSAEEEEERRTPSRRSRAAEQAGVLS